MRGLHQSVRYRLGLTDPVNDPFAGHSDMESEFRALYARREATDEFFATRPDVRLLMRTDLGGRVAVKR